MFDWARGTNLKRMMQAGVPGAAFDDWLEGWMVARASAGWGFHGPRTALDLEIGTGPRPHREVYATNGATVSAVPAGNLDAVTERFDLVCALSFDRTSCFQTLDFADPFAPLGLLKRASRRVKPGGVLLWSYLYAHPCTPDDLNSGIEPAAIFKYFTYRGFAPVEPAFPVTGRLNMYLDLDALTVRHSEVFTRATGQHRVVRVFAAVRLDGGDHLVYRRND